MTPTTRTVRELAFEPLECDIPAELTIDEYRSRRRDRNLPIRPESRRPRRRLAGLLRR